MEKLESFLISFPTLDPLPLDASFEKLSQVHGHVDKVMSKGPPVSLAALQLGEQCEMRVEQQGLFSANEDADDIATSHLRYLLVPCMLAEMHNATPAPRSSPPDQIVSWTGRLQSVDMCLAAYARFLHRLEQYDLVGQLGKQLLKAEEERAGAIPDPNTKRQAKIDRFKQGKVINAQLEEIHARRKASTSCQQDDGVSADYGLDEEDARQLWMLKLEATALRAIESRQMVNEEQCILKHMLSSAGPQTYSEVKDQQEKDADQRLEVLEKLRGIAGNLTNAAEQRQQLAAAVFRPSHMLPTRTLEEQAQIETADAMRREQAERDRALKEQERRANMTGEELDDEEVTKQREKDEFNDANPRGWGNSKLRPCA